MQSSAPAPRPAYPIRTRHKAVTRDSLLRSASELFATKGYEKTTLAAIAEHAGVHLQTLFRHFPRKELLVHAQALMSLEVFKEAIAARDPQQPFLDFWRDHVLMQSDQMLEHSAARFLQAQQARQRYPTFLAAARASGQQRVELMAALLASELGVRGTNSRFPYLFASMLWAGHELVLRHWAESDGKTDLRKDLRGVIGDVAQVMERWRRE